MSPPRRPTNEAMVLLQLLRALIDKMENQSGIQNVTNENLAAIAHSVSALNETLLALGHLVQQVAGVEIQARTEIAKQDRTKDLLQNLADNLFSTIGKSAPRKRKPR